MLVRLSAICFLAGTLTGRAGAADAQAFHDGIVGANKRLKLAGLRVAQALPALLAGNRDELPRFRAARDDAVRTVKAVEEQIQLLAPPDSESARALLNAERQFLAFQDRLVNRDFADLSALIEDSKLDAAERKVRVEKLLERLAREERDALVPLRQAYDAFVAEHKLPRP
jgi:hypothetical protein